MIRLKTVCRIAKLPWFRVCGVALLLCAGGAGVLLAQGKTRRPLPESLPVAQPQATPPAGVLPRDPLTTGGGSKFEIPKDHPLVPALKYAYRSREVLSSIEDYTAVFIKQELIGAQVKSQMMDLKLRHKPFSVYMLFRNPDAGREVLYVAGANGGNLLVHEGSGIKSIAGTVSLSPNDPMVTKESRHPITKCGVLNMLEVVIRQWEAETQFGEVELKYFPKAKIGETQCVAFQTTHPQPRRQFKFHRTRMYFDKQTRIPVRVEQFDWPRTAGAEPPLVEEYWYTNFVPNVGLKNSDFDVRNPKYRF